MASTFDRRGPDDRRASLLASSQAGRERGGAQISAHRAGGRDQVRGRGLRAALARVNIAVTSIVVVAFLAPIALLVAHFARDRALEEGRDQVAVATAVLTVTNDPASVAGAIAAARPEGVDRISVHGLASPLGHPHANPDQVAAAANGPTTAAVADGVVLLAPVPRPVVASASPGGSKAQPAIVEVF